jgi:hypothetical protein
MCASAMRVVVLVHGCLWHWMGHLVLAGEGLRDGHGACVLCALLAILLGLAWPPKCCALRHPDNLPFTNADPAEPGCMWNWRR